MSKKDQIKWVKTEVTRKNNPEHLHLIKKKKTLLWLRFNLIKTFDFPFSVLVSFFAECEHQQRPRWSSADCSWTCIRTPPNTQEHLMDSFREDWQTHSRPAAGSVSVSVKAVCPSVWVAVEYLSLNMKPRIYSHKDRIPANKWETFKPLMHTKEFRQQTWIIVFQNTNRHPGQLLKNHHFKV